MPKYVPATREVIEWALKRSGTSASELAKRPTFRKVKEWLSGDKQPTESQLRQLASTTHIPYGYFFLSKPPSIDLPISDFRTKDDKTPDEPSLELLDIIQSIQERQAWLSSYLERLGNERVRVIGTISIDESTEIAAESMKNDLGLSDDSLPRNSYEIIRTLREKAENLNIFVSISGVVGINNRRTLNPDEFRGFSIIDPYCPFIFVNGRDAKSAQVFTLAHELTHIWLGKGGVSNSDPGPPSDDNRVEAFCNLVAAELLVPRARFVKLWKSERSIASAAKETAKEFGVSPVVTARRGLELNLIGREEFFAFYHEHTRRNNMNRGDGSGGNFYNNQLSRLGPKFLRYVSEGLDSESLLFHHAYRLTDLSEPTLTKIIAKARGGDRE